MAFSYSISGVTDIDQRWDALPHNGDNYCVPASVMNWMYYYAAHGQPQAVGFGTSFSEHRMLNLMAMGSPASTWTATASRARPSTACAPGRC